MKRDCRLEGDETHQICQQERQSGKIYVSPFVGEWFFEMIKSVVCDYLQDFETANIIRSSIKER